MRIVAFTHNYLPHFNSGGETYCHRLLKYLQSYGHDITVIADYPEEYMHDGIRVVPQGSVTELWTANNYLVSNCDVVFSQLIGSAWGSNKAKQFNKPLVWFAHNRYKSYPAQYNQDYHVVYNSNYVKNELNFPHIKSTVLQPLVNYRDFKPSKPKERKYVTLINCNDNKGGDKLIALAKALPQYNFLGVLGAYGDQIIEHALPNLTYFENQKDITQFLAQSKIVIMPSADETFGQVATEAMCMGIPVIFNPTPGIVENMGFAGIAIDRNNLPLYAETISNLFTDKVLYEAHCKLCLQRAIELDPLPRVEQFNKWLSKIKINERN